MQQCQSSFPALAHTTCCRKNSSQSRDNVVPAAVSQGMRDSFSPSIRFAFIMTSSIFLVSHYWDGSQESLRTAAPHCSQHDMQYPDSFLPQEANKLTVVLFSTIASSHLIFRKFIRLSPALGCCQLSLQALVFLLKLFDHVSLLLQCHLCGS